MRSRSPPAPTPPTSGSVRRSCAVSLFRHEGSSQTSSFLRRVYRDWLSNQAWDLPPTPSCLSTQAQCCHAKSLEVWILWATASISRGNAALKRRDKALRTPASRALIDVMDEARLVRFGAGKAHLGAAFYAQRLVVETLSFVIWQTPNPRRYRSWANQNSHHHFFPASN